MLQDSAARLEVLAQAVPGLPGNLRLKSWRDAPTTIQEKADFLPDAILISLGGHLNPGTTDTPGTGHDVTRHLCHFPATCPVLIHSTASDDALKMQENLPATGCQADHLPSPKPEDVWQSWLPTVRRSMGVNSRSGPDDRCAVPCDPRSTEFPDESRGGSCAGGQYPPSQRPWPAGCAICARSCSFEAWLAPVRPRSWICQRRQA